MTHVALYLLKSYNSFVWQTEQNVFLAETRLDAFIKVWSQLSFFV